MQLTVFLLSVAFALRNNQAFHFQMFVPKVDDAHCHFIADAVPECLFRNICCLAFRTPNLFFSVLALPQLCLNVLFRAFLAEAVVTVERNHLFKLALLYANAAFINSFLKHLLISPPVFHLKVLFQLL